MKLSTKLLIASLFAILAAVTVQWMCYNLGVAIETGAPKDELLTIKETITAVALVNLVLAIVSQIFANRWVFHPLVQMIHVMHRIADGNKTLKIPHMDRTDEIGEMATALQVFKDNILKVEALAQEQKRQEAETAEARRKARDDLADDFETNVKSVVDVVASAATEMDATSRSVAAITDRNKNKLITLTEKIGGTANNVQMVSAATSELSYAVNEISQQVARATAITSIAVQEAQNADRTVQGLTEAAQKIGEVLEMINSIAEQINLLALNATIEAARAGDAGKGFAVVASEVKTLANQTTKATEQIAQYVGSIQGATGDTVKVIKNVGDKIREISEISTAIAAAVEEQGVATKDIANNVQQAAGSAAEVSRNANEVSTTSHETEESAKQMMSATSELSHQAEMLRREVDKFLAGVRKG